MGLEEAVQWIEDLIEQEEMEGGSFSCDVENVKEEEGVEVFVKDDDDLCLKKEVVKIYTERK